MSITYKWSIESMQALPTSGNLKNVVRDVQWKVVAIKDGAKRELSAFVRLSPPSDDAFTDYNSLTQDQVLEWVKSVLDVPAIEAAVTNQFSAAHEYRNPWALPEDYEPTNSAL
jgi:hypothetical protein